MNILRLKISIAAMLLAAIASPAAVSAADSTAKTDGQDAASIDKLVANQPEKSSAAVRQSEPDKPMTINFSDFVKDGAGCGVPNLDTSGK